MLMGFNDEIRYQNLRIHIQTEDSGPKRANITTLILVDGAVVASKKTSYAGILEKHGLDALNEDKLRQLMTLHHQKMIQDIRAGKLDTQLPIEPKSNAIQDQKT